MAHLPVAEQKIAPFRAMVVKFLKEFGSVSDKDDHQKMIVILNLPRMHSGTGHLL
jgi:hypothetical protein